MQQPPIDDDDDDRDDDHDDHDDPDATDGIYPCFLFHASSVWTQHSRRAPQRSQELAANTPPLPQQQQRCWSCCWWVASLSGFSFGCYCCCCCCLLFCFWVFFPLLSSLQFLHLEQTLCFLFWVVLRFLSASWREGHPRSKMNLQTVSTWYECTLYLVCFF